MKNAEYRQRRWGHHKEEMELLVCKSNQNVLQIQVSNPGCKHTAIASLKNMRKSKRENPTRNLRLEENHVRQSESYFLFCFEAYKRTQREMLFSQTFMKHFYPSLIPYMPIFYNCNFDGNYIDKVNDMIVDRNFHNKSVITIGFCLYIYI